jgi:hypothetical protein
MVDWPDTSPGWVTALIVISSFFRVKVRVMKGRLEVEVEHPPFPLLVLASPLWR